MKLQPPERFLRRASACRRGRAKITPGAIYILPTAQGLLFSLILLLMLIGSINYANNLGFLLTFLLAGLGIVAMLHTWRNLVGLELAAERSEPIFCDDQARFQIRLVNRRNRERPGIHLQLPKHGPVACDLQAASGNTLTLSKKAEQRGYLKLGRFTLYTRYPMGLLHAWVYVELDNHCLIYPRPGPRLPATRTPDYSPSQKGDRGVGVDDFVGLRSYRQGDSIKQIHWKSLAREKGLQTKQFGGDRADRQWLDWYALDGLDTEARLSALCRGILDACDRQQEYGLRLPNQQIKPGRGPVHRHNCLKALALFGATA